MKLGVFVSPKSTLWVQMEIQEDKLEGLVKQDTDLPGEGGVCGIRAHPRFPEGQRPAPYQVGLLEYTYLREVFLDICKDQRPFNLGVQTPNVPR